MHRRTTATLVTTLLALGVVGAAPLAAAETAADDMGAPPTEVLDEQAVRLAILHAAQEAQARHTASSPGDHAAARRAAGEPDASQPALPTITPTDLDRAVDLVDAQGAIGVTARLQTPDLRWSGAAGERALERRAPALDNSPFRVASNTKSMIAVLVMREVEAGTWTLDTRVDDVLPGLFPDHPDVTIEHLLSHTSGLPLGTFEVMGITETTTDEEFVAALARDYTDQEHIDAANAGPWLFAPGQGWSYSNVGYVALGMLLEDATGESVESLLRRGLLHGAGMQHTTYPDDAGLRGLALKEAMFTEDGWISLDEFDPDVFSHAGAAVSTTEDLLDLNHALFTGELVSPLSVDTMLTPVVANPLNYGLGVYSIPDPCRPGEYLSGHDGASFGTLSVNYSSRDGSRQLAFGITGRDLTLSQDALYDINALLVPMLLATC